MHVDFGCLFDKGLTLEVPEMVPFRLTQNVVDAFGVSGVEGAFRRAAEMTLQVSGERMYIGSTFVGVRLRDAAQKAQTHKIVSSVCIIKVMLCAARVGLACIVHRCCLPTRSR